MNLVKKWLGQVLGFNTASGPYPMYVTAEFDSKAPQHLDDGAETYLLRGFGGNPTVYSIIMHIVQMGASIPWKVQRWENGRAVDVPGHELYDTLLEHPNLDMSFEDFVGQQLGYLCIMGEALTFENEYLQGRFQWFPLTPSNWVLVPGERFQPISYWHPVGKPNERTEPERILQAKLFNPISGGANSHRGLSPIRAGLGVLTEDHNAIESSIRAFANQGPGGILSREKGSEDEVPLTDEQARAVKDRLEREAFGSENARKIIVTNSTIKWQQVGLSPVDLNILSQRQYTRAELCNLWHFPVELLNDNSASTYNNLTEMHKAAYLHAVIPLLYKLRGALNRGIQRMYNDKKLWITPDLSQVEVLQANKKDMVEWLAKAYWIKGTRKQELMGEEMDPAMDYYMDPNGQPLPTPEEAREARQGGPLLPGEEEIEEQANIRLAELGLGEYGTKSNGNGKH